MFYAGSKKSLREQVQTGFRLVSVSAFYRKGFLKMKTEITSKRLKQSFRVYRVNFPDDCGKIFGKCPVFYNAGIYGWNYDVYDFSNYRKIVIITGYRCPKCETLDSEKIRKLYKKFSEIKQGAARERLINNFLGNIDEFLR